MDTLGERSARVSPEKHVKRGMKNYRDFQMELRRSGSIPPKKRVGKAYYLKGGGEEARRYTMWGAT